MSTQPKISFIIPVYNTEKYLRKCLDSIINQTFKDIEIICINDESPDNSLAVLEEYAQKDSRVVVLSQKNSGQGVARNLGLSKARGKYIIFVDSDDYIESNMCEVLYSKMESTEVDLILFDYDVIVNNFRIPKKKYLAFDPSLINKNIKLSDIKQYYLSREPWYKIYKTSFIKKHNINFSEIRICEDTPFWYKILKANPTCQIINDCLYNYEKRADSVSGGVSKKFSQLFKIFDECFEIITNSSLGEEFKTRYIADNINWLSIWEKHVDIDYLPQIQKEKNELYSHYAKKTKKNKKLKYLHPVFAPYLPPKRRNYLEYIFSIKNKDKHKILNILGLKIEFGRKKIKKQNINVTQNIDLSYIQPIKPIKENAVTIIFSANDNFFEYLAVCIYSLIKYSNKNNFYDIVILEKDINLLNKQKLLELSQENISIRFYNIGDIINNLHVNFPVRLHFSIETYFRLFIPQIFQSYSKVLYIDCDTIFQDDVAEIYNENINEYCIGAVRDYWVCHDIYDLRNTDYYFNKLKLKNPLDYINGGVLVCNISLLQKENFTIKALELLQTFTPQYVDQCIINKVLEGKIKLLNPRYNVTFIYEYLNLRKKHDDKLPFNLKKEILEGRENPILIHYLSGQKPWKNPSIPKAELFWQLAREAGYYERILYKNIKR